MVYVENKGENLAALAYLLKSNESASATNPGYMGRHASLFPGINIVDDKSWAILKEHETNAAIIEEQLVEHAFLPAPKKGRPFDPVEMKPLPDGA